jgi:hypothetical protein
LLTPKASTARIDFLDFQSRKRRFRYQFSISHPRRQDCAAVLEDVSTRYRKEHTNIQKLAQIFGKQAVGDIDDET